MAAPLTHPTIVDGWFSEEEKLWPGQRLSLQVKEILHVENTGFQVHIRVLARVVFWDSLWLRSRVHVLIFRFRSAFVVWRSFPWPACG